MRRAAAWPSAATTGCTERGRWPALIQNEIKKPLADALLFGARAAKRGLGGRRCHSRQAGAEHVFAGLADSRNDTKGDTKGDSKSEGKRGRRRQARASLRDQSSDGGGCESGVIIRGARSVIQPGKAPDTEGSVARGLGSA